MAIIFLIAFLIVPVRAYCGIDFSMMGESKIWFYSDSDARIKANQWKWNELLLQKLIEMRNDLWHDAYDPYVGWMLIDQKVADNMYAEQYNRLNICIAIMENYKRHGIKGDKAMGAYTYFGETPL